MFWHSGVCTLGQLSTRLARNMFLGYWLGYCLEDMGGACMDAVEGVVINSAGVKIPSQALLIGVQSTLLGLECVSTNRQWLLDRI